MKTVFSDNLELKFIQLWHDTLAVRQGMMTSLQEKIDKMLVELNTYAHAIGHPEVTAKQIKNKIDSLKKKAKAAYAAVRVKTTTGCLVELDLILR